MIKNFVKIVALATAMTLLFGCGGGGGGGGSAMSLPTSYWTLDSHTFVDGGYSTASTNLIGGRPVTVAIVSTATLAGGDKNNGDYSGSLISFTFGGTAAGIYQVTADKNALSSTYGLTTLPIIVESMVGIAVTTGATQYRGSTGQVKVTIDGAGKYHFESIGPITAAKTLDVKGGVVGAPASMALNIYDAY